MRKIKRIFALITILVILALNSESLAVTYNLQAKFDGKEVKMESDVTDMSWTLENFLPGNTDTSSVTIKNTGAKQVTVTTTLELNAVQETEEVVPIDKITVSITNKAGDIIYSGKYEYLDNFIKTLDVNETETYTAITTLSEDAGNEYQNRSYKLNFKFTATGEEPFGTLTVRHVDENGEDIEDPIVDNSHKITEPGYELQETGKEIPGYEFVRVDGDFVNENGVLKGEYKEEGSTVTYHYNQIKYGHLIVKYVDDDEYVLKQTEDIKREGTEYSVEQLSFDGYEFVSVDGDVEGNYNSGVITVIFHYKKIDNTTPVTDRGNVIILYVDENEEEIEREVTTGEVGSNYQFTENEVIKEIPGYKFKKIDGDLTGQFKKEDTIIYCRYEKIKYGKLIVLCVDENNDIIKSNTTTKRVGEEYNLPINGEEIKGYTFVEREGNNIGKYTIEDTVVKYKYKRNKPEGPHTDEIVKTGQFKYTYVILAGAIVLIVISLIILKSKSKNSEK